MNQQQRRETTRQMLEACGALIMDDHFVYASGEHGPGWIAKDIVNMDPARPRELGAMLAEAATEAGIEVDVVCGPAIGGVICAQYTALALGVQCVFAERERDGDDEYFRLKRRYDEAVDGRRILVVDDVVNTGHSTLRVLDSVRAAGGIVVAAATWINRGNVGAAELGVDQFIYLDEISLPSIPADECQLCAQGKQINTHYAHGAEYMSRKG